MNTIDLENDDIEMWFGASKGNNPRLFSVMVRPGRKQSVLKELLSKSRGGRDVYSSGSHGAASAQFLIHSNTQGTLHRLTLDAIIPHIKFGILVGALDDIWSGGRLRVCHIRPGGSDVLCDQRLIEAYHDFFDEVERDGKSILVFIPKEYKPLTSRNVVDYFRDLSDRGKAMSTAYRLGVLGDGNYLYRLRDDMQLDGA
ncbi:unnamed protein product [Cuscuta campestris]|uniref:Uncharacterized protein n=1 Tax=Cuscuta campestris TaxID=132261 RepID=A0A484KH59_9ASTE|nr:unnamed protein product [Cuscuta campestris]